MCKLLLPLVLRAVTEDGANWQIRAWSRACRKASILRKSRPDVNAVVDQNISKGAAHSWRIYNRYKNAMNDGKVPFRFAR